MCGAALRAYLTPARRVLTRQASTVAGGSDNIATFAAGCFWSVELSFQRIPGVLETHVGYTNGQKANPTYTEVCTGKTGHAEAVRVKFDPAIVSYDALLEKFWSIHDPTTLNQQKNDVGTQYRSGIYYHNDAQKALALACKASAQPRFHRPIVTEVVAAETFYVAEDYHQRYLEKGGQCARKGSTDAIRCYG